MATDIRKLVDPDSYATALKQARKVLVTRGAGILVDMNLMEGTPNFSEEEKAPERVKLETIGKDIAWRIDEIDAALAASDLVQSAVALPKAAREAALRELTPENPGAGDEQKG